MSRKSWTERLTALHCLAFAVLGAWLLLAVSTVQLSQNFGYIAQRLKINSITTTVLESGALRAAFAWYAVALLLTYAAFGAIAWALGVATRYAFRLEPRRRLEMVLAWLVGLYGCVLLTNAAWYRNSALTEHLHEFATRHVVGNLAVHEFLLSLFAGLSCLVLIAVLRRLWLEGRRPQASGALALIALGAVAIGLSGHTTAPVRVAVSAQPNVILLGIDSLRCDATALGGRESSTPNVDRFLAEAQVFTDTITPLARTFPSWVSILTGRHPVTTNARVNLTPRDLIHEGETLPRLLRAQGYRTVLATDEVRFSNIDESYGYDQMIAPPIGGTDFILGAMNDLPLPNLLANTRLAQFLFPNTYANRAAYKTYDPQTFVDRFDRELRVEGPAFIAVHLTLPHWPYAWKDIEYTNEMGKFRQQYPQSIRKADEQFQGVMEVLRRRGLLDNAIVVLLSDHGEALGKPGDSLLPRSDEVSTWWWNSLWGHGTSVLSQHQYQVLFAWQAFGNRGLVAAGPARHAVPASLEDLTPTLVDLLELPHRDTFDGRSLASLLRGDESAAATFRGRARYTETEFNPPGLRVTKQTTTLDEGKIAAQAAYMYDVLPSGRLQLKPGSIQTIIRSKELAVFRDGYKLAAIPTGQGQRTYFFTDPARPFPVHLKAPPEAAAQPVAAELWTLLDRRFPGEIAPAVPAS